jgi:hypothetical protein
VGAGPLRWRHLQLRGEWWWVMADKKITKAEIKAAVKAGHAKRETAEQHDKGVVERLRKAIRDEAEKN